MLAERSIFGVEVFLPQRRRLDDVAVAVENDEVLCRTHFPSLGLWGEPRSRGQYRKRHPRADQAGRLTAASGRSAARTSSSVGHQSGRSISVMRSRMMLAGPCPLKGGGASAPKTLPCSSSGG